MKGYISRNRIEWKFILAKSPWMAGFYERMVGTVKRCLRKVLSNARVKYDELETILIEVEGTINSRPLTYEYDEVGSEVLTPAHLIYGRRLMNIPDEELEDDVAEGKYLARLRYLAKLKEHFWSRWRKEYLTDLREYHKLDHAEPDRVIQLGEPVLVYEEKVSRCNWKMGVVEKLVVGKDGRVRGAKIKLIAKGKPVYIDRPIQKLYPLQGKAQIARN